MNLAFPILLIVIVVIALKSFKLVPQSSRLVVYRLGRPRGNRGPGIVFILPFIDKAVAVSSEQQELIVSISDAKTQTESVRLNAKAIYRLEDPQRTFEHLADYKDALSKLLESVAKRCLLQFKAQDFGLFKERFETKLKEGLSADSRAWGIAIDRVEVSELHTHSS